MGVNFKRKKMIRELKKQISLKKRRLRDRSKWWEELRVKDIGEEKADRIMKNLDRQKKILDRMTSLLSELNQLERDSKITKVKTVLKLEKLFERA